MIARNSSWAVYALVLSLFAVGLYGVLSVGGSFPTATSAAPRTAAAEGTSRGSLSFLLPQLIVIIAASRTCARAARRLGQPDVIGEIAAGLCLGPSLLGLAWPQSQVLLFAPDSLGPLLALSQVGLILFMFIVGLEINPDLLKEKAAAAVSISHASIVAPFLLGAGLSLFLYKGYAPAGVPFASFALFMGTAMSVTAFPVLARILHDKGLTRSPLGAMALTCAAVDDVTAWCALAAVVGLARHGTAAKAAPVALSCGLFVAVMVWVVRPALARWLERRAAAEKAGTEALAAALVTAFAAALATEFIGIHALFGAFLAGVLMPREAALRQVVTGQVERFTTVILLPIFFALTGLRTQLGLLADLDSWLVCGLLIAAAVMGKLGASAAAARWSGMPWRESLAVGTLMNARGLVELVVLNIGYDLGVISPAIFTMMVLMALATTVMTGPLLDLLVPASAGNRAGKSLAAAG